MATSTIDTLVFGHRLRHERRRRGLTLDQLGELVGKPGPSLSQLENGHTEPKLGLIRELADALGCSAADLLDSRPPSRRAELEIAVARIQAEPRYRGLRLPHLKPGAKVPDDVLEHVVALYGELQAAEAAAVSATDPARVANLRLRSEMRERDNYYPDFEAAATEALAAIDYPGYGPISERMLIDLAAHFGFTIDRVQDLPKSARSVTDLENRVVYIPQRNELPTRSARSVVLSTIGHFALHHSDPRNIEEYLRQRVESNYFAAAVLAPEAPAVKVLREAKANGDVSTEDLKEVFYISYEMAAHRITNLATRHLGITVHFMRTDEEGVIRKAYENDGVPFPAHVDGTLEGQRVPPTWGPRQAFQSSDTFSLHHQYTDTPVGPFWCVTHVEVDASPHSAVTLGTTEDQAGYFRGSDTTRRLVSSAASIAESIDDRASRWAGRVWPSARDRQHVVAGLPELGERFSPFPGVDIAEVYEFVDRHA